MPAPPRPAHDHFIFGDESSRTNHKFLVVGTMDCPREQRDEIIARLTKALKGHSEYGWTSSPSRDLDHFVDEIFDLIEHNNLWFRCMVVKQADVDHKTYSGGDKDLSLEKFIYVHLRRFARAQAKLEKLTRFYVELDNRTTKYQGPALKGILNRRFQKETGHRWEIFADVADVDSKSQIMVQAADVLAGCVAWVWNRQYENGKVDPERVKFAKRIARVANLRAPPNAQRHRISREDFRIFGYPTVAFQEKDQGFAIWRVNLRKAEEVAAEEQRAELAAQYPKPTTFRELGKDYEIGAMCFACNRFKRDILPVAGHRSITSQYRPLCAACGEKGFLTFTKRKFLSSTP
jgi:Protein of unknown function (DUF3800)